MSGTDALGKSPENDPSEESEPRKPTIVVVGARDRSNQGAAGKNNPGGGVENRKHPRLPLVVKVRMVACTPTLEMTGVTKDDLIEGVEVGGAADYLDFALDADINLFV